MAGFARQALSQQRADDAGEQVAHLDVPRLIASESSFDGDSDVRHGPPLGRELHAAVYWSASLSEPDPGRH